MKKVIWGFRIAAVVVLLTGGTCWALGIEREWTFPAFAGFLLLYFTASLINVWSKFFRMRRPPVGPQKTTTMLGGRGPEDPPPPPPATQDPKP
ncbi:MAG: hypothetical protein HYY93_00960 [Planctomycetes bacterium]|nr:hypothetical protein [Planctomycetota bacterium]